jgi:hypothetical protein
MQVWLGNARQVCDKCSPRKDRMNETPQNNPPRYCSVDGMSLMNTTFTLRRGFDPYTGAAIPDEVHLELTCPTRGHGVWRLYDDKWIRTLP